MLRIVCLNYRHPLAAKCLLWAEAGDVAVALAAVDVVDVVVVNFTASFSWFAVALKS